MKKRILSVLTLSTLLSMGLLTSCQDEFTEEDVIQKQQEKEIALAELTHEQELEYYKMQDSLERVGGIIVYSVQVMDASKVNTISAKTAKTKVASSATVKVVQNGVAITQEVDEDGLAVFSDMRIGKVNVTISSDDYTTAIYTADITPYSGSIDMPRNASTIVPIFPTTLENGAGKITGKVEVETNLLNDEPEFATGAKVTASLDLSSGISSILTDATNNYYNQAGRIESISYTDATVSTTVGEDGTYELIVPAGIGDDNEGLPIKVSFANYASKQILIQNNKVDTVDAVFVPGGSASAIPNEDGIAFTLPEFATEGSGAEFNVTKVAETLSAGTNIDIEVINGGSGYIGSGSEAQFKIAGADSTFAVFAVVDGKISHFKGLATTDNLANNDKFTSTPQLGGLNDFDTGTEDDTQGSGASFSVKYMPKFSLELANGGSNYSFLPVIQVKTTKFSDMNLSNGTGTNTSLSKETEYEEIDLSQKTGVELIDGKITFLNNFDLGEQGSYVSFEVTEVTPQEREAAVLVPNINSDGEITSVSIDEAGQGYTPGTRIELPVTTLNGNGSGAVIRMNINDEGEVALVEIIKGGSEYSSNANMATQQSSQNAIQSSSLNASGESVVDFNYGTGSRD